MKFSAKMKLSVHQCAKHTSRAKRTSYRRYFTFRRNT